MASKKIDNLVFQSGLLNIQTHEGSLGSLDVNILGNVVITGNLSVIGTTEENDIIQNVLQISDKNIFINRGEPGNGITKGTADPGDGNGPTTPWNASYAVDRGMFYDTGATDPETGEPILDFRPLSTDPGGATEGPRMHPALMAYNEPTRAWELSLAIDLENDGDYDDFVDDPWVSPRIMGLGQPIGDHTVADLINTNAPLAQTAATVNWTVLNFVDLNADNFISGDNYFSGVNTFDGEVAPGLHGLFFGTNGIMFDDGTVAWMGRADTGAYIGLVDDSAPIFYDGTTSQNVFHDNYHPNADKWTTARTVTFATGDVTGNFTIDGSANVSNVNLQVSNDSHSHTGTTISALDASDTTTGIFNISRIPTGTTSSTVSLGNHSHALLDTATNANTANTLVKRDASGNFSAGTITASLTGNASTASSAAKWTTARTVTFATGDVTGNFTIDGSANVSNVNLQVSNDSHSHTGTTISALDAGDTTTGIFNINRIPTGTTVSTVSLGDHSHALLDTATNANTANTLVKRDASGNFSAGTITASLSGNATSATTATTATSATSAANATNINVVADNSTNATHYITFTGGATGNQIPNSDTALTYNPSSNVLTTGTFSGALSGNATTATSATNATQLNGFSDTEFGKLASAQAWTSSNTFTTTTKFETGATRVAAEFKTTDVDCILDYGDAADDYTARMSVYNTSSPNYGRIDWAFAATVSAANKTMRINNGTVITTNGGTWAGNHTWTGTHTFNNQVTASSFNATSSIRYKENVVNLSQTYINSFMSLRPVEYDVKASGNHEFGFIAEETNEYYPEIVLKKDGIVEAIDYSRLTAVLTAIVQEHEFTISDQETRISYLEDKIDEILYTLNKDL